VSKEVKELHPATDVPMLDKVRASVYERDLEYIAMIASGIPYKEIARLKNVSDTTVRISLYKVRDTLGVEKVAQVAMLAHAAGLLLYVGDKKFVPNVDALNGSV
jgi:DNA-binding NarL/FixJ family response regulator